MITVYLKGAPEEVFKMCSQAIKEGNIVSIVENDTRNDSDGPFATVGPSGHDKLDVDT